MSQDVLLVSRFDILVVERFARLGVDPSDVQLSTLESTVEMLDQTSDIGQLESTLNREGAICFHLPSSSRRSERSDLGIPSHDDHLVKVDQTSEFGEFGIGVERFELGELESEVGPRCNFDLEMDLLGFDSVRRLVIERVVDRDGTASRGGELERRSNLSRERSEIDQFVHPPIELWVQHERQSLPT